METRQLKCKQCGGNMQMNAAATVLFCPSCHFRELLVESDDVKIAQIQSETELGKKQIERSTQQLNMIAIGAGFILIAIILAVIGFRTSNRTIRDVTPVVQQTEMTQPPIDTQPPTTETTTELTTTTEATTTADPWEIAMPVSINNYLGQPYARVVQELQDIGFSNIGLSETITSSSDPYAVNGMVEHISINGNTDFEQGDRFRKDAKIRVSYYVLPDTIPLPAGVERFSGANYEVVVKEFTDMGFTNIEAAGLGDLFTGWFTKDGSVERISINGNADFRAGDSFPADATIRISYHSFPQSNVEIKPID